MVGIGAQCEEWADHFGNISKVLEFVTKQYNINLRNILKVSKTQQNATIMKPSNCVGYGASRDPSKNSLHLNSLNCSLDISQHLNKNINKNKKIKMK